jgi:hypothetical protein
MLPLTAELDKEDRRPYFLWDEDISVREFRRRLAGGDPQERLRLLGKLMREARDTDVWLFISPLEAAEALPRLQRHLGRRRAFWEFLIEGWRRLGLLAE